MLWLTLIGRLTDRSSAAVIDKVSTGFSPTVEHAAETARARVQTDRRAGTDAGR